LVTVLHRDPFSGPFPLHDLATLLYANGHDPLSEDAYLNAHGLSRPAGVAHMRPHNPLFDAWGTEVVWRRLMSARAELEER
jgi:hypothetical protein